MNEAFHRPFRKAGVLLASLGTISAVACSDLFTEPSSRGLAEEMMLTGVMTGNVIVTTPRGPIAMDLGSASVSTIRGANGRAVVKLQPFEGGSRLSLGQIASGYNSASYSAAPSTPPMSKRKYEIKKVKGADGRQNTLVIIADSVSPNDRPPAKLFQFVNGKPVTAQEFFYRRAGTKWVLAAGRFLTFDNAGKQSVQINYKIRDGVVTASRADELKQQLRDVLSLIGPTVAHADEEEAAGCLAAIAYAANMASNAANIATQLAVAINDCATADPIACAAIPNLTVAAVEAAAMAATAGAQAVVACTPKWTGGSRTLPPGGGGGGTEEGGGGGGGGGGNCIEYWEGWYYPETDEIDVTNSWWECY